MDRLEKVGREARYDGMVKPVPASVAATGKRRPAYINYTPEGRRKEPCGSSTGKKVEVNG